jgi:hypothetical protein
MVALGSEVQVPHIGGTCKKCGVHAPACHKWQAPITFAWSLNCCIRFGNGYKAELYTCGFSKLGLKNPNSYYKVEGYLLESTENAIKNKLGLNEFSLDMVNHCMNLEDPGKGTLRGHFGGHYDTMKHYVENPSSRRDVMIRHLERLKRTIVDFTQRHAHQQRKPVLRIATMCKSGRHRSVILATYLEWCLRDANFDEVTVTHVNSDEWDHLCTTCTKCGPCSWLKVPLKNEVVALWNSL